MIFPSILCNVCVCMCVCASERHRQRDRDYIIIINKEKLIIVNSMNRLKITVLGLPWWCIPIIYITREIKSWWSTRAQVLWIAMGLADWVSLLSTTSTQGAPRSKECTNLPKEWETSTQTEQAKACILITSVSFVTFLLLVKTPSLHLLWPYHPWVLILNFTLLSLCPILLLPNCLYISLLSLTTLQSPISPFFCESDFLKKNLNPSDPLQY